MSAALDLCSYLDRERFHKFRENMRHGRFGACRIRHRANAWLLLAVAIFASLPSTSVGAQSIYITLGSEIGEIGKISPSGVYSTFATGLSVPDFMAFSPTNSDKLYVADSGTGYVDFFGSNGQFLGNYPGFGKAIGVALDAAGNLFVSSADGTIRKVTPSLNVSIFATLSEYADGIEFDSAGNLYCAEFSGGVVARITPDGMVSTFASGFSGLEDLAFDKAGNLYVSDYGANLIAKITPGGNQSTFANITAPVGIDFDAAGNLFVAQYTPPMISKISPNGVVTVVNSHLPSLPRGLILEPVPEPSSLALAAVLMLTSVCLSRKIGQGPRLN
jgi:sugar lactone lactonase YvrE